ncbi:uncharacterized protein NESG_01332 [Nematocida ausubeli]|uniref:DNA polymerase epsilon catalytic subunit n=1 Tax=Nematocida ausubeli (strain ATCC PRA-371 / ERTm2) TaxID=1913371 RepID=A0A086J248_NEMA1|nr:uncharacterized protein NESG_01332 [Nematocida ausubeli]KFG26216.1 hypothetical protein NESG_01332 [Nematocida ausubeli]
MENAWDASILADYFKYNMYSGEAAKEGWLLNYQVKDIMSSEKKRLLTTAVFYFIDAENNNFRVEMPFSPKILLEVAASSLSSVEDYLNGRYPDSIKATGIATRTDLQKMNHLATDGSEYLVISMYSEKDAQQIRKEIDEITRRNTARQKESAVTLLFAKEKRACLLPDPEEYILSICEYDISASIQMAIELDINAGKWYTVQYMGGYIIGPSTRVLPPDLRIFSFDIETTKDPLKFPSADKDQVMMISIMSTQDGWLITNREIVGEDIMPFEFRPKSDIGGEFEICNEKNEKNVLNKFVEILLAYKPHVVTTYNGDFFDWPFVEARLAVHGINMQTSIGFYKTAMEEYICHHILHLDCYKWVKRDSYLPAGSQGLKSVTKAKLGYFPDEIDPEYMVECAKSNPKLMASYSVSDAVATHFLYLKYVHPFIFSLASLIPLPPDDVLRKGSGTLCEALLMKEAYGCGVLIPSKKKSHILHNYNGYMAESLSYVGGHVECLKSGLYRSDFEYEFSFNRQDLEKMVEQVGCVVDSELEGKECYNRSQVISEIQEKLRILQKSDKARMKPHIYHLDVGAMYPNIILTNRLQPTAVMDDKACAHCAYAPEKDTCQRKMRWKGRAEVLAVGKKDVQAITKKTRNMFIARKRAQNVQEKTKAEEAIDKKGNQPYKKDTPRQQSFEECLRDNLIVHAKNTSKKTREIVIEDKESIICQRENPFYVNAVRKFRDRRNEYKRLAKEAKEQAKKAEKEDAQLAGDWKKKAGIYDSLQIAHKCVLNSFYGYVMKKGARWHSMEMAAVVCQTGSNIIQNTKAVIDAFGITLELDTDGIWALLPESFPLNYTLNTPDGSVRFSYICSLLNFMLLDKFSNPQYLKKEESGEYTVSTENSIRFEIDGPYKAMFLPGSMKEGESIKKRYIVINSAEKISELKGFEFKRRGELKFVKAFQEETFNLLLQGKTLQECYAVLAECADYWIDIIETRAESMSQDVIFGYFGETRSLGKSADAYSSVKSTSLTAAARLSELLGQGVAAKGTACSFIIVKYPENAPVTSRSVPQAVFHSDPETRTRYLQKWLEVKVVPEDIREIIDWSYYLERLSSIITRILIVPASLQGISNPVHRVQAPSWAIRHRKITDFLPCASKKAEVAKELIGEENVGAVTLEELQIKDSLVENMPENASLNENSIGENSGIKNPKQKQEKQKSTANHMDAKITEFQKLTNFITTDKEADERARRLKEAPDARVPAVFIREASEDRYTAVYFENNCFVEKVVPLKKVFYLHADSPVLDRIASAYTSLSPAIHAERLVSFAVGLTGRRDFVKIEMDTAEFKTRFHRHTALLETPEVRGIYELNTPSRIAALCNLRYEKVAVYALAKCILHRKPIYALYSGIDGSSIPSITAMQSSPGVEMFTSQKDLVASLKKKAPGLVFCTPAVPALKVNHFFVLVDTGIVKPKASKTGKTSREMPETTSQQPSTATDEQPIEKEEDTANIDENPTATEENPSKSSKTISIKVDELPDHVRKELISALHRAAKKALSLTQLASYADIPVLPGDWPCETLVLDLLYHRKRKSRQILGWNDSFLMRKKHYSPGRVDENPFKTEFCKEGIYTGISSVVSVSGSVLLSLIEADTLLREERSSYALCPEMHALQDLAKHIVYSCIQQEEGANSLARSVSFWLRTPGIDSALPARLSEKASLLQTKFIARIVSAINAAGCEVVSADSEELILHTGQSTLQQAQVQTNYALSEVTSRTYGSLLQIDVVDWLSQAVFVDSANYRKIFLSGEKVQSFITKVPSQAVDDLLEKDDLQALEWIQFVYQQNQSEGISAARLFIKIFGLKFSQGDFPRKAARLVELSPFSEEMQAGFGESICVLVECRCSAGTSFKSQPPSRKWLEECMYGDTFFSDLLLEKRKIDLRCRKCCRIFSRDVLEKCFIQKMHTVAETAVKMEKKCSLCKLPSKSALSQRCSCGGRFARDINKACIEAMQHIAGLCALAPIASVIVYAREIVAYLDQTKQILK